MSIGTDLRKAAHLIEDIEIYVAGAAWHPGKNFAVSAEIGSVDQLLRRVERMPPPAFAEMYLEQMLMASDLRRRWLAVKDCLPPNPWGQAGTAPDRRTPSK
jgi:hypothetical protein